MTVPHEAPPLYKAVTVLLTVVGLGLNVRVWTLLGPHLYERFDVGLGEDVVLLGLPLLVATLVRLPIGVLTDRYGARVLFPAVSLAGAASAFALGLFGALPAVVVAGASGGVAGSAYVVGATVLTRLFSYGRRGLALGVFSLGPVVTVAVAAASRAADQEGRRSALALGVALVVFALVAALALRDGPAHDGSAVRACVEMIKIASATSLSMLYALALGGLVAIAVYLPVYLVAAFRLERFEALTATGTVVLLAAAARLVGGWWADRRPTARLLVSSYAVAAALCLVAALELGDERSTALVIGALAICDGLASGVLLALIGKAARAESAGAVMGVTGAAAAFGALAVPSLMAVVDGLTQSYFSGWFVLAGALIAAAVYVRVHPLRVGLGLAVRFEPGPSPTILTVVVVAESDTQLGAAAIVSRLAELAVTDELVAVYGAKEPDFLLIGLRERLTRHSVVAVRFAPEAGALGRLASLLDEFVESGTVTIAMTPTADLRSVAAELASYLKADRVLMASFSAAAGAHLHEVWTRA